MESFKKTMFVITHKRIEKMLDSEGYNYLSVGSNNTNAPFSDKAGVSISEKNPNYCELTGLYWIWKNVEAEEVGLCHYRRFFCKQIDNLFFPLSVNELSGLLEQGDIIIPKSINLYMDYFTFYEKAQRNDALRKCCDYLINKEPAFENSIRTLLRGTTNHCYNMFYCKKETIDAYCEWLFELLFDFENRIDISGWSTEQQRVYGFLSEFLFNVWIKQQGLDIIEVDVSQSELFPASLETDANKIQVSKVKKIIYRLLPIVWPLISKLLVTKVKVNEA